MFVLAEAIAIWKAEMLGRNCVNINDYHSEIAWGAGGRNIADPAWGLDNRVKQSQCFLLGTVQIGLHQQKQTQQI